MDGGQERKEDGPSGDTETETEMKVEFDYSRDSDGEYKLQMHCSDMRKTDKGVVDVKEYNDCFSQIYKYITHYIKDF